MQKELKEMRLKFCDQASFNHELIKAQAMLEKLKVTLAQRGLAAEQKVAMLRGNIFQLLKKDGRSDYQAMYDTHYMNQDWDLLSEHVGTHLQEREVPPAGSDNQTE